MKNTALDENKLWMDKYHPKSLGELSFNPQITELLKSFATENDFPHLIFYGPEGSGKLTRIRAFIQELYSDPRVHNLTSSVNEVKINSTTIEYQTSSSPYHIEFCPSEAEFNDRHIVQKVIKESASNIQLDKSNRNFRIIVLIDLDLISKDAQSALRRTMEKYSSNCRLLMSCTSLSKVIQPIRSRCVGIRVSAPSKNEIKSVLSYVNKAENAGISDSTMNNIADNCNCNLMSAINNLQMSIFIK